MLRRLHRVTLLLSSLSILAGCSTAPRSNAAVEATPVAQARVEAPAEAPAERDPDLERRLEKLCAELERSREEFHVPGMAIAVVKDGEIVLARGFGDADLETGRDVTEETLFAIGSTSKAFTATLIAMQVDEGKLSWDAPITDYLPEFQLAVQSDDPEAKATVRDLLSHRTGFFRNDILWGSGLASRDTILAAAVKAEPAAPFRAEFHYNNIGFVAAGEASARAEGKTWDELLAERILEPLGMRDTNTSVDVAGKDPDLAKGYWWNEEADEGRGAFEHQPMRVIDSVAPAGAINSNARDMAQWVRFLLARGVAGGKRLVSEEQLLETWNPAIQVSGEVSYGLGWMLHERGDGQVVEHGGNIDGFSAEVALLPDSNLGFALLMNVSPSVLQATAPAMVWEALLGEHEAESAAAEPAAGPSPAQDDFGPYLGMYVGDFFQFKPDTPFEVKLQNDRLAVDVPGQLVFELLEPDAEGKRAFAIAPAIQVSFERDEADKVVLMKMYQSGLTFELMREGFVPPPETPLEELQPYLGAYQQPDGKTFQIVMRNNRLAVDYPDQTVYELYPPDERGRRAFRMTDLLAVEFHESEDGSIPSLTFYERGSETVCSRVDVAGLVELPTLDEILALRRAEEFENRLSELGACRLRGGIRFVHAGAEGTAETTFEGSERYRDEWDIAPFGWERKAVDENGGSVLSAFEPPRDLEGRFLAQERLSHPGVFFGDWRKGFDSAEVIRTSVTDSRKRFVVRLRRGQLSPTTAHVDAETGDVVQIDMPMVTRSAGEIDQTMRLEDWRDVDGLRLPFRYVVESEGSGKIVVEFESFETNLQLPDDYFRAAGEPSAPSPK